MNSRYALLGESFLNDFVNKLCFLLIVDLKKGPLKNDLTCYFYVLQILKKKLLYH